MVDTAVRTRRGAFRGRSTKRAHKCHPSKRVYDLSMLKHPSSRLHLQKTFLSEHSIQKKCMFSHPTSRATAPVNADPEVPGVESEQVKEEPSSATFQPHATVCPHSKGAERPQGREDTEGSFLSFQEVL